MTDRLIPSPDARVRVQHLGQKELQAFFDEIPESAMRSLARYLPPVDGFRRVSAAGIVKRKEALARRLSHSAANEKDFNALYILWRTWINETQRNAPLILSLIEELEEVAAKANGPDARKLVIEQHTDLLLQKLKEESEQNRSTREDIERLYTFSPLPQTAAAQGIIATAKRAADVEHDVTYQNLPTRLEKDERETQAIKAELKALNDRVTAIADNCARAVREAQSSANAAHAAVNEKSKQPTHDHTEARIKLLTDDLEVLRKSVGELTAGFDPFKQLIETTQTLGDTQTKLVEEQKLHTNQINQIAAAFEHVKGHVDALLKDQLPTDRRASLAEQIAELTRRVDIAVAQPQSSRLTTESAQHAASINGAFYWTLLPAEGEAVAISSCAGLATAFTNALLALGMRRTGAQLLAEECAAAIAAQQVIFLQGAFATRVAHVLATAIGGIAAVRLAMPIGILDSVQLHFAIDKAFASLNNHIGGLAIEGINHVPLDLIQEIIANCVRPTAPRSTLDRRIAVFATLSQGIASLPIGPEALELGPIFDLDYLDWRTSPDPAPLPRPSFLSFNKDQAIFAQLASTNANVEEAVHLVRVMVPGRNPAVERSVARAYQALHLIRSEQKTITSLHSLFYGWILPYWRMLGLSKDQVDSEFGRAGIDVSLDERLTAMLAIKFPENMKDVKS